jgi:RNA polymerase sigma-70 factor, ECF subfamily
VNDDRLKSLVPRFLDALHSDDHASLMMLMSEDATLVSDSGGRVRATLKVVQGNERIARLLIGLRRKKAGRTIEKPMLVNNDLGIVSYVDGQPAAVLWFEIESRKIVRIYRILNPDKLKRVPAVTNTTGGYCGQRREYANALSSN